MIFISLIHSDVAVLKLVIQLHSLILLHSGLTTQMLHVMKITEQLLLILSLLPVVLEIMKTGGGFIPLHPILTVNLPIL